MFYESTKPARRGAGYDRCPTVTQDTKSMEAHGSHDAVVALVEWNWMGHHPDFFVNFTGALREVGATVLALCPEPDEARRRVREARTTHVGDGEELWFAPLHKMYPPWFCPPMWRERAQVFRQFQWLDQTLGNWERQQKRKIDLVFFACIYDSQFIHPSWGIHRLARPWSGLYLNNHAFRNPGAFFPGTQQLPRPEAIFRGPWLRSAAVLDEAAVNPFSQLAGGIPVVALPEVIDTETTPEAHPLERKIRRFAGGRPVVGCLGQLQPSKGTVLMAKLALDERFRDICFVFAGKMLWDMYSKEEQLVIRSVAERSENAFTHFERLADGPVFNAAVQACDVLALPYLGFPNSSNMLTKAAYFEKPVIVSDGYLMAERVRHFDLGEVVPEGDAAALSAALRRIVADVPTWKANRRPRWRDYCEAHSFSQLKRAFEEILAAKAIGA